MSGRERPELSIIVFAFEEEQNVGPVLAELCAWLVAHEPAAEIIFVDDGSRDATAARAAETLRDFPHAIVRHDKNSGIGAALKSGVRAARGTWVTFMPADGQIEPAAIATLRGAQLARGADVVFSIYADRDDGLHRKLLSFSVRALIRAVHGVWLSSDGPYLFRRTLFVPEQLPPDSFFLNFEFPIRTLAAGIETDVVTISCRPRRAGQSKSTQWFRILGVARELLDLRIRRFR